MPIVTEDARFEGQLPNSSMEESAYTERDILPQELIDILSENAIDTDSDDDEENMWPAYRTSSTMTEIDDFEDNSTALAN